MNKNIVNRGDNKVSNNDGGFCHKCVIIIKMRKEIKHEKKFQGCDRNTN